MTVLPSSDGKLRFTLWKGRARRGYGFKPIGPSCREGRGAILDTEEVKVCTYGSLLQLRSWKPGLKESEGPLGRLFSSSKGLQHWHSLVSHKNCWDSPSHSMVSPIIDEPCLCDGNSQSAVSFLAAGPTEGPTDKGGSLQHERWRAKPNQPVGKKK